MCVLGRAPLIWTDDRIGVLVKWEVILSNSHMSDYLEQAPAGSRELHKSGLVWNQSFG